MGQSYSCKDDLFRLLERKASLSNSEIYSVKVRMLAVPKDSIELDRVSREFTMSSKGTRVLYESKEMSVYSDEKYIANVLHGEKIIYLNQAPKPDKNKVDFNKAYFDKSVLVGTEVSQCKNINTSRYGDCKMLELKVLSGPLASRAITSLRFVYSEKDSRVLELKITYGSGVDDAYAVLQYFPGTEKSAESYLSKSVSSILFKEGGNLAQSFQGYRLIKTYEQ